MLQYKRPGWRRVQQSSSLSCWHVTIHSLNSRGHKLNLMTVFQWWYMGWNNCCIFLRWLFALSFSSSCFRGVICINEWCGFQHSLHLCASGQFLRKWPGLKQLMHRAFFLTISIFQSRDMEQKPLHLCNWCFALHATQLSWILTTYNLTAISSCHATCCLLVQCYPMPRLVNQ